MLRLKERHPPRAFITMQNLSGEGKRDHALLMVSQTATTLSLSPLAHFETKINSEAQLMLTC